MAKILNQIIKKHWYRKNFEGTAFALYQWQILASYQKRDKLIKSKFKEVLTITADHKVDYFWNQEDLLEVRSWLVNNIRNNPKFAPAMVGEWEKRIKAYYKLLNQVDFSKLDRLSDKELATKFEVLYDAYIRTIVVSIIVEGFSLNAEQWLGKILKDELINKGLVAHFSQYFALLTQATRPSFIQEAAIAKRQGTSAKELARRFYWINFNYLHTNPLTEQFFNQWQPEPAPNFKHIQRRKQALMKKIKLSQALVNMFEAADLFTWWQDQRKKNALLATEWSYKFLLEAGKRSKIPKKILLKSLPNEFRKVIKPDKAFMGKLRQRKDPLLVYADDTGKTTVVAGVGVAKLLKAIHKAEKSDQVSGSATYLGCVRGRAVLIRGVADMKRFQTGNILIASMTRPEFTPILSKAGAIVTDEGGITSHAAIISREMKKPCVIGTRVATKVFKDGDMVEVDANKGIVRKIK